MKANIEEHDLIQAIIDGQVDEFQQIIKKYQKLVWHITAKVVPSEFDREDICQDIFVKVYKNLRSFKFESKLSTWIARIAYNTALNFVQKKKPELYEDISPEGVTLDSLESDFETPETAVDRQNVSEILKSEIAKLPMQYKMILTLYHLEELSYTEIGKILKLPDGTIKSHLFRARKLLKSRLELKYTKEDLCQ